MVKSAKQHLPPCNQHVTPCKECPFKKDSLRSWLGGHTAKEFVDMAHGEDLLECHMKEGSQCAGGAIYRGNVCKLPRDRSLLVLPQNKDTVIASRAEFMAHHTLPGRPTLNQLTN
jgi:hypothetical protein